MKNYKVHDSISGDCLDILAETPKQAAIKYLKQDVEPNPHTGTWEWDLTVSYKYPYRKKSK